jgi:hypothetical protein
VQKYSTARQTTDDNAIWCMRLVCWITKATNTHSEYVIVIAFPLQQWFRERDSVSHYTYTGFRASLRVVYIQCKERFHGKCAAKIPNLSTACLSTVTAKLLRFGNFSTSHVAFLNKKDSHKYFYL